MDKGPEGDESDVPEWKKAGILIPHRTPRTTRQRILRMTKRMRGRKETSSSDPTVVMHLLSNLVQGSREDSFPLKERGGEYPESFVFQRCSP